MRTVLFRTNPPVQVSTRVSYFLAAPGLVPRRDARLKAALTSLRVRSNASRRAITKWFLLSSLCGTKSPSRALKNKSEAQHSTRCASLCGCPGQKQHPKTAWGDSPTALYRLLVNSTVTCSYVAVRGARHSLAEQLLPAKLFI